MTDIDASQGAARTDVREIRDKLKQYAQKEMESHPEIFARLDAMLAEAEAQAGFDYGEPAAKGIGRFLRKGIRRCVAWFVVPLFEQQRIKNERTARILREMSCLIKRAEWKGEAPDGRK